MTTRKNNWNFLETAIVPRNYPTMIIIPLHCLNWLICNSESFVNPQTGYLKRSHGYVITILVRPSSFTSRQHASAGASVKPKITPFDSFKP